MKEKPKKFNIIDFCKRKKNNVGTGYQELHTQKKVKFDNLGLSQGRCHENVARKSGGIFGSTISISCNLTLSILQSNPKPFAYMEDQENYWFYSLCLPNIKVLNVLFTTILAKIYLVLTVKTQNLQKWTKLPLKACMESKHKFWHGPQADDRNLSNLGSTAAVSRLHVTPEATINSEFLYYIYT